MSTKGRSTDSEVPDFELLFEASPTSCLILDPDLVIRAANDSYLRATMTARDDIVGRSLFDVFPDNPENPDATGLANLAASLDRVRRELVADAMAPQQFDIRRPEANGGEFEVRNWSPINTPVLGPDRELRYIIHRIEDITEFVRLKQLDDERVEQAGELRERATLMEAEIDVRSQELQAANRRLLELDRVRSSFLSWMSHELRTPMNAVLGFTQVLQLGELSDDQREAVGQIARAGTHLLSIINDVLEISRIDSGRLNLSVEPVQLTDVVGAAIELVRAPAAAAGITISSTVDEYLFVTADRQRLLQVLINLLSNAVKYNRPHGSVSVVADAVGDTHIRLSVNDTGHGIAEPDLQRLFDPFERLGAEQSDIEGAGFGLTVTRGLVERMGGILDVESTLGVGSSFGVELPTAIMHRDAVLAPKVDAAMPFTPRPISVVYIEDNAANLRLVERTFEIRGQVQLDAANRGVSGLALVEERQPDLVLLDLHLPDIDGEEVLRRIRENPLTAKIPVVVISADGTRNRIERLRDSGADRFLTKPIDVAELLAVLDELTS